MSKTLLIAIIAERVFTACVDALVITAFVGMVVLVAGLMTGVL